MDEDTTGRAPVPQHGVVEAPVANAKSTDAEDAQVDGTNATIGGEGSVPGALGYAVVEKWTEDEVADPENPPAYVFRCTRLKAR